MDTSAAQDFWATQFVGVLTVPLSQFMTAIDITSATVDRVDPRVAVAYIVDYYKTETVKFEDFLGASMVFGPPNVFVANIVSVATMPCFLGRLTAAEARKIYESETSHQGDGLYMLRLAQSWAGFEVDFVDHGVLKTGTIQSTSKGFTSGGPCFDTLPSFIHYYTSLYRRPYNRSFPRMSCFRWDLGLKETHALLKSAEVNQFLLRLSTSNQGCLSMGYKQSDEKPTQILITLSSGGTYTVGATTFTDFETLLAAPAFINLKPMPSPTRSLGPVLAPLTEYFEKSEETNTNVTYVQRRRGSNSSLASTAPPTTDPSLYLMTTQISQANDDVVPTRTSSTHQNTFPSKAPSSSINSFPSKSPSPSNSAFPAKPSPPPSTLSSFPSKTTLPTTSSPTPSSSSPQQNQANIDRYARLPKPWADLEADTLETLYQLSDNDLNHLKSLTVGSTAAKSLLDQLVTLWLNHSEWKKTQE